MKSVKAESNFKEYQIDYDTDLKCFWVSGLTPEEFWIDIDFQYFDNPSTTILGVMDYAQKLSANGVYVDILDVTEEDDTYHED